MENKPPLGGHVFFFDKFNYDGLHICPSFYPYDNLPKNFHIKIQFVFIGFSAKLKVLKDLKQIEGFKDSPQGPVYIIRKHTQ